MSKHISRIISLRDELNSKLPREVTLIVSDVERAILPILDREVQKAFQRGAGLQLDSSQRDSVDLAREAKINHPEVLSNLYSRDQGFKP